MIGTFLLASPPLPPIDNTVYCGASRRLKNEKSLAVSLLGLSVGEHATKRKRGEIFSLR